MEHHASSTSSSRPVIVGIAIALALYGFAVVQGWPQHATQQIVEAAEHANHESAHDAHDNQDAHAHHEAQADTHDTSHAAVPAYWSVIPFALLLGAIAVLPLLHKTEHWWESNLHRFYVAAALGLVTLSYYIFFYNQPIERHFAGHAVVESTDGADWHLAGTVLQNAILGEYIPFIVLLFSLYTISGGIRIQGDLPAHPLINTLFMAVGGLLASFVGTTGAAMLLIRPLLETNSERQRVQHTVVFFIFVVCNCGGCLLPIGDPPLFLGYLQGVDFLWTMTLWPQWLLVNGLLLLVYYLLDRFYHYPKETRRDIALDERRVRSLKFSGLEVNVPLLLGVVLSVALLDPTKTLPGTDIHPWIYSREMVQLALVGLSLSLGSAKVREANRFNYAAIVEVAALFIGIFICMQPALQILDVQGSALGVNTPQKFFWYTGGLSSVLDNAPTYLVFFKTARTVPLPGAEFMAGVPVPFLAAVSLGAVFMGAMTYIGNGPNFMVKAVAEKSGVKMPSFFGYTAYSCGFLLPILVLMSWLFL